jgi:hypothetical protein
MSSTTLKIISGDDIEVRFQQRNPAVGHLWWFADDLDDACQMVRDYTPKGARVTVYPPEEEGPIPVIIEVEKARVREVLNYQPDAEEWLDDEAQCDPD